MVTSVYTEDVVIFLLGFTQIVPGFATYKQGHLAKALQLHQPQGLEKSGVTVPARDSL